MFTLVALREGNITCCIGKPIPGGIYALSCKLPEAILAELRVQLTHF